MTQIPSLIVGGITPFTTVDFPGRLAAVLFCQGCPLRCPYCHNIHLQAKEGAQTLQWQDVVDFLDDRRGFLDGVVLSGGEPLMQAEALSGAIADIKDRGFAVALHTAGTDPAALKTLLPSISWVGLDIKAPFKRYKDIKGFSVPIEKVQESLVLLRDSDTDFEIRTTLDPRILSKEDLLQIAEDVLPYKPPVWGLQQYRPAEEGGADEPSTAEIESFFKDKVFLDSLKAKGYTLDLRS